MGVKTISIMNDVHDLLIRARIKDESFSEVIRRILAKNKNIMKFAGALKNISEKDAEEIKKNIEKIRKKSTRELLNDNFGL